MEFIGRKATVSLQFFVNGSGGASIASGRSGLFCVFIRRRAGCLAVISEVVKEGIRRRVLHRHMRSGTPRLVTVCNQHHVNGAFLMQRCFGSTFDFCSAKVCRKAGGRRLNRFVHRLRCCSKRG